MKKHLAINNWNDLAEHYDELKSLRKQELKHILNHIHGIGGEHKHGHRKYHNHK